LAGAASAADLAARPYTKAPPPAPIFSWTGFYIGVHGGGMWADKDWTEGCSALVGAPCTTFGNGGSPFRTSHQISSALGGVQGGYNWQVNSFVLGVEADWSWTGNRETCSQIIGPAGFFALDGGVGCSRTDWLGTVTGRAGLSMGQALFYGKAGVAFAHDSYVARCSTLQGGICANSNIVMTTSPSEDRVGWTVGVGAEYAFTGNWSVKAEYNYMDFGTERNRFQTIIFPVDSIHDINIRQRVNVAKVGINYRFGGPVVAKY
jgi:outer membrane immunogenic protein